MENFLVDLIAAILNMGFHMIITTIVSIFIQFIVYQTTGISLYNEFIKHLKV